MFFVALCIRKRSPEVLSSVILLWLKLRVEWIFFFSFLDIGIFLTSVGGFARWRSSNTDIESAERKCGVDESWLLHLWLSYKFLDALSLLVSLDCLQSPAFKTSCVPHVSAVPPANSEFEPWTYHCVVVHLLRSRLKSLDLWPDPLDDGPWKT